MELQTITDTSTVLQQIDNAVSQWTSHVIYNDNDLLTIVEDMHSSCHALCHTLGSLLLEDDGINGDASDPESDHVSTYNIPVPHPPSFFMLTLTGPP